MKATNEQIVTAYRSTGSVWKAALELGMAGQTVHERLRAIGYPIAGRKWTSAERDELARLIETGASASTAASRLGRTFAAVTCELSRMGKRVVPQRAKKVPRGAGYDKASMQKHMRALDNSGKSIRQYCVAHGLNIETFARAAQHSTPDLWQAWTQTHGLPEAKRCEYCSGEFYPMNAKQTCCTRKCADARRRDIAYFGGNRSRTIGLAEGVCQMCGRHVTKGLSSHHVLGKVNDSENEVLIALCPGCHQIVSIIASRPWADNTETWEVLIQLALAQRHGAAITGGEKPSSIYAYVEVEFQDDDGAV